MKVEDLGKLPGGDRNHELQELTATAMRAAFPPDRFYLRPEGGDDKGIDQFLELRAGGFTNFRAHVQLKGTDTVDTLTDGSKSLSGVKVSSITYLLNGQSGLYFLYVAPTGELWYAWAADEKIRLDRDNAKWRDQATTTINFTKRVDPAAVDSIYDRVLREGLQRRQIQDIIARAMPSEKLTISLTPATGEVIDPEKLVAELAATGRARVSSGQAKEVLAVIELLNPNDRKRLDIRLVRAYANFTQGKYLLVQAELGEIAAAGTTVDADDKTFVDLLNLGTSHQLGQISFDEYVRKLKSATAKGRGSYAVTARLEALRHELLVTRDPEQRRPLREVVNGLVDQILTGNSPEHVKVHAQMVRLHADADECQSELLQAFGKVSILEKVPTLDASQAKEWLAAAMVRANDVVKLSGALVQRAEQSGYSATLADALLARAHVNVGIATVGFLLSNSNLGGGFAIDAKHLDETLSDLDKAAALFLEGEAVESRLRALIAKADVQRLRGNKTEAAAIGREVAPIAEALRLANLAKQATDHVAGTTHLDLTLAELHRVSTEDETSSWANMSDEELDQFGEQMLGHLDLPSDRLPNLRASMRGMREVMNQQFAWCRHMQPVEHLEHTQAASTMYAEPVKMKIACSKHRYLSKRESTEVGSLVDDFKTEYCADCPDKAPKPRPV